MARSSCVSEVCWMSASGETTVWGCVTANPLLRLRLDRVIQTNGNFAEACGGDKVVDAARPGIGACGRGPPPPRPPLCGRWGRKPQQQQLTGRRRGRKYAKADLVPLLPRIHSLGKRLPRHERLRRAEISAREAAKAAFAPLLQRLQAPGGWPSERTGVGGSERKRTVPARITSSPHPSETATEK